LASSTAVEQLAEMISLTITVASILHGEAMELRKEVSKTTLIQTKQEN
jgi:hypothetical protein